MVHVVMLKSIEIKRFSKKEEFVTGEEADIYSAHRNPKTLKSDKYN